MAMPLVPFPEIVPRMPQDIVTVVQAAAHRYVDAGLSLVPIEGDGSKRLQGPFRAGFFRHDSRSAV